MKKLSNCLLFVPVAGLHVVFSLFMNHSRFEMEINNRSPS